MLISRIRRGKELKPTTPLLLCFFVWLFSSSTIVEDAWKVFVLKKNNFKIIRFENLCGAVFSIMEVKLIANVAKESRRNSPVADASFQKPWTQCLFTLQTPHWRWSRRTRLGYRQTRTAPTWSSGRRSSAACPRSQNSGTQPESRVIVLCPRSFSDLNSLGFSRLFQSVSIEIFLLLLKGIGLMCQWWRIAFVL